jgi:glycosyltransferase involved in cell wall biosynthesis
VRLLIAGGVFRLSVEERERRQPAPEVVLAGGLAARGIDVRTLPLEELRGIATSSREDVLHVHHLSKAAVLGALSPFAAPMVFTAHGTAPPTNWRETVGLSAITRSSRVRARVCLSEAERQAVIHRNPALIGKVHVIPNGVDLPVAHAQLRVLDAEGPVQGLFVGQLIDIKQVDRLINALVATPRLHLQLVFHNDALRDDLQREAHRLGVAARVQFVGQLHGTELFDAYRRAHILFLPSRHEALPTVITEALSTGLPVIASRVGGVPEQVREAGILVSPRGNEALVGAIQTMVKDYPLYAARAHRRAASVATEFSIDAMVEAHIELYVRVMEEGDARPAHRTI